VIAALGRPFPAPRGAAPVVLVGGGYGAAPLVWWAAGLRARAASVSAPARPPVSAVLGAGDQGRLFGVEQLGALGDQVRVTTDDGSAGRRGRVTDALDDLVEPGCEVYACGPMAMLRAVTELALRRGARAWCTVEESLACGIGVCMTCVLPVRGSDGLTRMTRTCVDGPTFDGAAVRWDAVRTGPGGGSDVPTDCVGAPRPSGGGK